MFFTKLREYLSVGLAIIACMSTSFALITHMRNSSLNESLVVAVDNNRTLVDVNNINAKNIQDLLAQRVIDDKLIKHVFNQYEVIRANGVKVQGKLEEIKANDKTLSDLLNSRHPASISELLNSRKDSNETSNHKVNPAK